MRITRNIERCRNDFSKAMSPKALPAVPGASMREPLETHHDFRVKPVLGLNLIDPLYFRPLDADCTADFGLIEGNPFCTR